MTILLFSFVVEEHADLRIFNYIVLMVLIYLFNLFTTIVKTNHDDKLKAFWKAISFVFLFMALHLTSYGLLSNLLIRLGGLNFDFLKLKSISLGKWICTMYMDHQTKVCAKLELLFVQVVIES